MSEAGSIHNFIRRMDDRISSTNAIQEINHTGACPEHTAVAQMIARTGGIRLYRAKCRNCGQSSPEYTDEQWKTKWPKGIGCEWPKKKLPTMIFDGQDFIEEKLP